MAITRVNGNISLSSPTSHRSHASWYPDGACTSHAEPPHPSLHLAHRRIDPFEPPRSRLYYLVVCVESDKNMTLLVQLLYRGSTLFE